MEVAKMNIAEFGKLITASTILARGDIILHSITVVATSDGVANISIYDGENTSAEKKIKVTAAASTTKQIIFTPAFPLRHGLYVSIGSNVDCVYLTWSYR
ncbi:hypothetical protein DRN69_09030 [Candidatus Pacearchaeota archaeon]|nr:MAG: hypothetical protein DRN69_09030 [Candidatus Pacearchaeota archaeon]